MCNHEEQEDEIFEKLKTKLSMMLESSMRVKNLIREGDFKEE